MAGFACSLKSSRGIRAAAGLRFTVNHRAVRHVAAMEMKPLDNTRESLSLGRARHLDAHTRLENVALNCVAEFNVGGVLRANLAQMAGRLDAGLLEVPRLWFVDESGPDLPEADLDGYV